MSHGEQPPARGLLDKVALRNVHRAGRDLRRLIGASPAWPTLADRGVGFGDRVTVLMTNRIETVEASWPSAAWAVVVLAELRLTVDEVAHVAGDSGSVAMWWWTTAGGAGRPAACPHARPGVPGDRRRCRGRARCRGLRGGRGRGVLRAVVHRRARGRPPSSCTPRASPALPRARR